MSPYRDKRGFGCCRRRIATSWRRMRISAFFAAVVRVSSTSQPTSRQKTRYSRRGDTADHHPQPDLPRLRWSTPHRSIEPLQVTDLAEAARPGEHGHYRDGRQAYQSVADFAPGSWITDLRQDIQQPGDLARTNADTGETGA
jgi:hypothetical protein